MTTQIFAQTARDFAADWDKQHISTKPPSEVRHADLKGYLEQLKKLGLKVAEAGKSFGGREIYQVEWGAGPLKIFMWSQMHGDEPTATSALMDFLAYLKSNREKPWIKELESKVTIRAIPMLNPDGAELYQRRNLQFIDINRDARNLATPEGRLLKKLRDEWKPEIGFNLHNQNPLTTVGSAGKQATISLLAVSGNPEGKSSVAHERNKRLCAVMIAALETEIKGHVARYDDDYNPRAFGDMMSAWGTQTILIETGALHGRDEMLLVRLNFAAYLTAFKALTDGSEKKADPRVYDTLPFNGSGGLYYAIFRQANIINPRESGVAFRADIAVNAERRRANDPAPMFVQEIGDASIFKGLDEYNARDFYVIAKSGQMRNGAPAYFLFYKKTKDLKVDWKAADLETAYPPDAIFKDGKWIKGAGAVPKLN